MNKRFHEFTEKEFRKAKVPISCLPIHLPKNGVCSSCKKITPFDWLEKKWLINNLNFRERTPKYFKRTSFTFICAHCNRHVLWQLGGVEPTSTYHFFGDEAYRTTNDSHRILTYATIGTNTNHLNILKECLTKIKREMLPDLNTNSWCLHVKDFFQEGNRERSVLFKNWSQDDANRALDIAQFHIKELPNEIIKSCSVAIAKNPDNIKPSLFDKYLKQECFWLSYIHILDLASKSGVLPEYYLESDNKDGWGLQGFIGLKYTPLFCALSKGNNVAPPAFLKKKPNQIFELSDVIAFSAARESLKTINGEDRDVTTENLGEINWYGFDGNGEPRIQTKQGYPWAEFHNLSIKCRSSDLN